MDEKQLWGKLNELNANFAKVKELKKKQQKEEDNLVNNILFLSILLLVV